MKFSYTWLKDHLETSATVQVIGDRLSEIGFEVEQIDDSSARLKDVVVARVDSVIEHPNSDHLHICSVEDGRGSMLEIVCGAKNVRVGMKTALVHCGGWVPQSNQPLKPIKIRGVESRGMLCSREELGLESDGFDGILELPQGTRVGDPVAGALGMDDPIFTVSITSNRGDCFSVRGLARELAASGLGTLKSLDYSKHFPSAGLKKTDLVSLPKSPVPISIETDQCSFFIGAVLENVQNTISPEWMQMRLKAAGQRPIDALVDVTNFLNFDIGQPMHVYDLERIHHRLRIRQAYKNEKLTVLNGQECFLSEQDMIVADETNPLTIAGIMGGEASGTSINTHQIFLEAACFNAISVTKTGQRLMLRSESRTRFERGIDPEITLESVAWGLTLIQKICHGQILGCSVVQNAKKSEAELALPTIALSQRRLIDVSGDASLTLDFAETILNKLDFKTQQKTKDYLKVTVPSWRHDVAIDVDLIEEVLRIRGYKSLKAKKLPLKSNENVTFSLGQVKTWFCSRGFNEVCTIPFLSAQGQSLFSEEGQNIEVLSPLNVEMRFLRNSIIPSLLTIVTTNQNRSYKQGAIFEIESVFRNNQKTVQENIMAAGLRFGASPKHWLEPSREVDIFDIKADFEAILSFFSIKTFQIVTDNLPKYYHPNRSGAFMRGKESLGYFGEIHPSVLNALGLDCPIVAFEFFVKEDFLSGATLRPVKPFNPSLLQSVQRDFAFVVDEQVQAQQLLAAVQKASDQITYMQIFDVFKGKNIGIHQKSIAVRITLQPKDKTFSDDELQSISNAIMESVKTKCQGTVRAF